jgi:hypothetical protein
MGISRSRLGPILALTVLTFGLAVTGQQGATTSPVRVLVVDETRTFLSTVRVGALVGVLKGAGIFHVDVRFADVVTSWDDPLAGETPDADLEPYDIILVVPLGIDDATVDWVALVSAGPPFLAPPALGGVELIGQVVEQMFEGNVRTIGVYDHLLVALLYGVYTAEGWMR